MDYWYWYWYCISVCRPLDRQMDLLFILDGSGSVSGSTFATQMNMLNKFVIEIMTFQLFIRD